MGSHLHRRALHSAAIVLAAASAPISASAQALVRGFVYDDSTGIRLAGAAVMLVDPSTDAPVANTRTDSLGQFVLKTGRGKYQIAAVREGYNSVLSAPVPLADGEQLMIRVPIAMNGDPHNKIGVLERVRASSAATRPAQEPGYLADMARRRMVGTGLQFNREELQQSQAHTVGDFLRRIPGVDVREGSNADNVQMRRSGGSAMASRVPSLACHVGWFVDGMRIDRPGAQTMTDGLSSTRLEELEAMEVFRGISEMPPEFAQPDLRCGAIALWTRRG
jgi:hypothetical protein